MGSGKWGRPARDVQSDQRVKSIPGKKDRKRWCGGKVGVEHDPHWEWSKWTRYWAERADRLGTLDTESPCTWSAYYWRDEHGKLTGVERTAEWRCQHRWVCKTCGKVLDPHPGKKCPNYHERTVNGG